MVQVRTWCDSPMGSHQSTNDPAGRLHNNALRLCAEQHWACSKTSAEITCKFLGLSVEPELEAYLETDYSYSYNRYTTISKTDTCRALRLTSFAVCHLSFMSCWSSRLTCLRSSPRCTAGCYRSFAAMEVFLILWQIRHASLQPTLCTSSGTRHRKCIQQHSVTSAVTMKQSLHHFRTVWSALCYISGALKTSRGVLRLQGRTAERAKNTSLFVDICCCLQLSAHHTVQI